MEWASIVRQKEELKFLSASQSAQTLKDFRRTRPAAIDIMRTNIDVDNKLMNDALKATGLKTRKEVVELALRTLVRLSKQAEIRKFKGKLKWDGDLDEMRSLP